MGIERVNSMQQMKSANVRFHNKVKNAQKFILATLANINHKRSIEVADRVKFSGTLSSMIELESLDGGISFRVLSSAPHSLEIEEGLKNVEFRFFSEYPKLRSWARQKGVPEKGQGIFVGKSPGGVPHPNGLHFMKLGFDLAVKQSDQVISTELAKLA